MNKSIYSMRKDNAEHKRVELHMHSSMSQMDGVTPPEELIRRAFAFGHKAAAITDHGNVQAFPAVMKAVKEIRKDGGDIKPIYGMEAYFINDIASPDANLRSLPVYHLTILVRNKVGLKNLYKLVSLSYTEHLYKTSTCIPFSKLQKYRQGLIIGSACAEGEIYQAMLAGKSQKEIYTLAEKYDYFEIQPTANRDINIRISELAERTGKLCAATGDVHFTDEEDGIFRKIIRSAKDIENADEQPPVFFRTTEEMLMEFDYLGAGKAFEVVVANTNKIADMIDSDIRPIPNGAYTLKLPEAEKELGELCFSKVHALYGEKPPAIVKERLERELKQITKYDFSGYYMTAKRLVEFSENNGFPVIYRGNIGSALTAFLLGITDIDPLPPHYRCPKCCHSEFITDILAGSGFDLPLKVCPDCGSDMIRSGQDIPIETFMRYNNIMKAPEIHLIFSPDIHEKVRKKVCGLFGADRVFISGKTGIIHPKTARENVKKYCEEREIVCGETETELLAKGCLYTKRCTGAFPSSLFIIPDGHEVYDFTPAHLTMSKSDILQTHFDFNDLHGTLPMIGVWEDSNYNGFTVMYKRLEDMTGIKMSDVPIDDPLVYRLFTSAEPLKLSEDTGVLCGTLGIPKFSTEFVMQMLIEAQPKTFSDIIKISGLSHDKNTWNIARELIRDGVCTISNVIGTRDDIILYLIRKGINTILAYNIAEIIRVGNAEEMFDDEIYKEFHKHDIPSWFTESCKKINYLCPKAHATVIAMAAVRLAWFKLHFPAEFYAALLEDYIFYLDRSVIEAGREAVKKRIETLRRSVNDGSHTAQDKLEAYILVLELMSRGIEILAEKGSRSCRVVDGKINISFNT